MVTKIGGGKSMGERLRNLAARHFVLKSGNEPPQEAVTPEVYTSKLPAKEFMAKSNEIHARHREEVERDILTRKPQTLKKALDDWD